MIIMKPPEDGTAPFKRVKFESTGREARYNADANSIYCITPEEVAELEREGWTRKFERLDTDMLRKAAAADSRRSGFKKSPSNRMQGPDLLRRAAEAEFRHQTGQAPADHPRRVTFGEVDAASFGRLHVAFDQGTDELAIHGVATDVSDGIDNDLAVAVRRSAAAWLDAELDASERDVQRAIIAGLVQAVLNRHGFLADAVARQRARQRYEV